MPDHNRAANDHPIRVTGTALRRKLSKKKNIFDMTRGVEPIRNAPTPKETSKKSFCEARPEAGALLQGLADSA